MNTSLFYHWGKQKYLNDNSPKGDFVNDMIHDRNFPWYHNNTNKGLLNYKETVITYLENKNACEEAINTFKELFDEYNNGLIRTYQARSQYYKDWRKKNPDKIREYNARYWENRLMKEKSESGII